MELRIDKYLWISACLLSLSTTSLLFIPLTASLYFSLARYIIYVVLAVGLAASVLIWHRSFKLSGWRNHVMALLKSVVLFFSCSSAVVVFIMSHSGI